MAAAKKKLKTPPPQFLYGFKNNKDQVLIEPKFEIVGEFERGQDYTRAKVGEKWGLLSKTGDWACEPRFELIGKVFKNHFAFKSGLKWGLADTDGKEVAKAVFDDIISVGQNVFTVCQGKEFKILDFKSKEIAGGFDKIQSWNDGFAIAIKGHTGGMISEKGQWLFPLSEDPIYDFSEGLAAFDKEGKSGYYDIHGKVAIKPQFHAAFDFSDGLARVQKDGKYGYIDKTGKIVIPCEWGDPTQIDFSGNTEEMTRFRGGYAKVARMKSQRLEAGYIDKRGNWHDADSLPKNPRDDRELKSFRLENPEWESYQEGIELGAGFEKALANYKKKLHAALEKDEASVAKTIKELTSHSYDKKTKWLRLTVYDMNDYTLTIHQVGAGGKEIESPDKFFEQEKKPFKNVAKFSEKEGIEEPKTAKGIKMLGEFTEECALETLEWFADIWKKNGGAKLPLPAYIQNEDSEYFLDLSSKKKVTESDIIKNK